MSDELDAYTWAKFLRDGGGDPDYYLGNASPVRIAATVRALDAAKGEIERLKSIIRQAECLDVDLECAWCHADMRDPENTHERDCIAFTMAGVVR